MKNSFVILVADRNPRIGSFIQRELKSDDHRVITAENAEQLNQWLHRAGRLDVLVIDPDMPGLSNEGHLSSMLLIRPTLPVIFHCMASDCYKLRCPEREVFFVEKSGQSIDLLKQQIVLLLMRGSFCGTNLNLSSRSSAIDSFCRK